MMTDGPAERGQNGGAGPTRVYLRPERDQMFLLPVSMRDWLEPGHLVWFLIDAVARMDTRALHRRPSECIGRPPYEPEMMCTLLLYAYCRGIRSSRPIEAACRTDAAFRVICGGLVPDHVTISRFAADLAGPLGGLFVEGVRLCAHAGLVDLSVLALDGTKIAANASRSQNRDAGWIRREIEKLLALTGSQDRVGVGRQDALGGGAPAGETPVASRGSAAARSGRSGRLRAALEVIEAQDSTEAEQLIQAARTAAAAAQRGRHVMGRKPKEPRAALARAEIDHQLASDRLAGMLAATQARQAPAAREAKLKAPPPCRIQAATEKLARAHERLTAARAAVHNTPASRRQANITDPDSRVMATKDGWVQGYNAQAIVNQNQIVLACQVSQDHGDVRLYAPMLATLSDTLARAGISAQPELILADAGYWSHDNATAPGPDRLIATKKDHNQRRAARLLGTTDGPPAPDATPVQAMEHLLRTPQGTAAYAKRSHLIEPVFGDHKHNRHLRRFRRRGQAATHAEWALIHLAGNLLKLHQHHPTTAAA